MIYRDGDSWAATPATPVVLSWGVRQSGPAVDASGFSAPFSVLTAAQIAATEGALAAFADVGNVTFTQVAPGGTTDSATILVGAYTSSSDGAGAYAWYPGSTADASADGDMWINNFWANTSDIPIGSYDYYIYLHELGHSMGLAHPGDYNAGGGGPITYQTSAQFVQDSQQYSVMSYFLATDTEPGAPTSYADTLMMYDIYALQELYGVNSATRSGNDTYGFHATLGGAYDFTVNLDPLLCIWDGAGRDTLNLSGFGGRQIINLNDGTLSNVGGYTGNLSIAVGASIENAVGGLGRDQIIGNELGNLLRGGRGIDILIGAGGNDRLSGNLGADRFVFADGCDRDRITDFNKTADRLGLSSDLWGGGVMTAAEVLAAFGTINAGNLVLNFGGGDVVTLLHVSSLVGMADSILIT